MKIIVVEPQNKPYTKEIRGDLKSMQDIVKGLIEPIYIDNYLAIIVNEEGKIAGLPANRIIYNDNFLDIICGTCFICMAPPNSDEFESIPDTMIEIFVSMFSNILVKI